MVRCGGVCISSDTDIVIITGTHQDISDTIRLEKTKFAERRLAEMNQTLRREQLIQENYYQELLDIQSSTVNNNGFIAGVALNYGGRDEIVRAARAFAAEVAAGKRQPQELTEGLFDSYLYSAGVPDPELIIRPSGEMRTSNFLLWQSAYSEYVFMDVLWPDFGPQDLDKAIAEYHRRNRRFGGV